MIVIEKKGGGNNQIYKVNCNFRLILHLPQVNESNRLASVIWHTQNGPKVNLNLSLTRRWPFKRRIIRFNQKHRYRITSSQNAEPKLYPNSFCSCTKWPNTFSPHGLTLCLSYFLREKKTFYASLVIARTFSTHETFLVMNASERVSSTIQTIMTNVSRFVSIILTSSGISDSELCNAIVSEFHRKAYIGSH